MYEIRQYEPDTLKLIARYRTAADAARAMCCSRPLVARSTAHPYKLKARGYYFVKTNVSAYISCPKEDLYVYSEIR